MRQKTIPPTPPSITLAGKTALVTGANSGLGLETARQFLLLHVSRLIITTRSRTKSLETIENLRNDPEVKSKNPDAVVEAFEVEMDDGQSVTAFVGRVKMEVKELHVLVLNAGIQFLGRKIGKMGNEEGMQGEFHLLYFMLIHKGSISSNWPC
jgi:NAD(P)-dependent dehydrogenase (short-subunit alcohol dehydrogenase family)